MATIVALIAIVALDRYTFLTKEARVLRLEVISHHFMTAAANLRIEFLISDMETPLAIQKGLLFDGKLIYVSAEGWPASGIRPVNATFRPTDADCYHLWQILLQNPAPITTGQLTSGDAKYRVFAWKDHCRYSIANGEAYFDYFPLTGRLLFFGY